MARQNAFGQPLLKSQTSRNQILNYLEKIVIWPLGVQSYMWAPTSNFSWLADVTYIIINIYDKLMATKQVGSICLFQLWQK